MRTILGSISGLFSLLILLCCVTGCSNDNPVGTTESVPAGARELMTSETAGDVSIPSPLVDVVWNSETLTLWPYTGENFSGTPSDPVNLIFVGHANALEIRAALLALDGNRAATGLPNMMPFNSTWTDCIGNVQDNYAAEEWIGSVVQLELGDYSVMRIHLRLFETDSPYGSDGRWTVGAAHFDLRIPGTAEHQVISWELAESIVAFDLQRSGLLDPSGPALSGVINDTPSFRTIPAVIYNGIPDGLKIICKLPPGTSATPVPIPSDGKATILCAVGAVPVGNESKATEFTLEYNQIIPAPFCNKGPLDYVRVTGPLRHEKVLSILSGRFQYSSTITGHLTAIPVNVLENPPVPAGEPFMVIVSDEQRGILDGGFQRVTFLSRRIAPRPQGAEKLTTKLHVSSNGENIFQTKTQCLGPEE